ncbi:MAG: hypothetical protein ACR2OB_05650 [Solirubrobacteraceae bacterium]
MPLRVIVLLTDPETQADGCTWLGDRYLVLWKLLGDGTVDVSVAHDTVLDRLVEIRLLPGTAVGDAGRAARFAAGARAAASVTHPNVVSVFDRGEDKGRPFVVCARSLGLTLAQTIAAQGPLNAPRAIRIGAELADALVVAHRGGVVHGAVGADTIILRPDGSPALVNLGLATNPGRRPADDVRDLATTLLGAMGPASRSEPLDWLLHLAAETASRRDGFAWDAAGLAHRLRRLGADQALDREQVDSPPTAKLASGPVEPTVELPLTPSADHTRLLPPRASDRDAPTSPSSPIHPRLKGMAILSALAAIGVIAVAMTYQAVGAGGAISVAHRSTNAATTTEPVTSRRNRASSSGTVTTSPTSPTQTTTGSTGASGHASGGGTANSTGAAAVVLPSTVPPAAPAGPPGAPKPAGPADRPGAGGLTMTARDQPPTPPAAPTPPAHPSLRPPGTTSGQPLAATRRSRP